LTKGDITLGTPSSSLGAPGNYRYKKPGKTGGTIDRDGSTGRIYKGGITKVCTGGQGEGELIGRRRIAGGETTCGGQ